MMAAKPTIDMPVLNLEIPALAYLASRDQWVCWDYRPKNDKWTKPPFQTNGIKADSSSPATWTTMNAAIQAAFAKGIGVGYVLNRDIVGVDLDECRNKKTGITDPWAREVIQKFNSFTEVSPSGTGFHIICRGKLPEGVDGRKGAVQEIYTAGRYLTVTGNIHQGSPETIEDRQEAIDWFLDKFFKPKLDVGSAVSGVARGEFPFEKWDALMTMDDKFRATWLHKRGDMKDQSLSTYDMALCVRAALVGWTDEELASLIHKHRVEKWHDGSGKSDRQDYIDRTISYARSAATQHSDGGEKIERAEAVAVARAAADDVARDGPDAALTELRTRLGIPVKRAIITGIDRALGYAMELEDGRIIEIGSTSALLDQRRFRCAVAETTKDVLPMVKQPVWDGTVKVFLAAAEHVEPGDEDPRIAIAEAIEQYFDREKPCEWDAEGCEVVFLANRPIKKGEARGFYFQRFRKWLDGEGYPWKDPEIKQHLKACGFTSKGVSRRIAGSMKTKSYWLERNSVIGL